MQYSRFFLKSFVLVALLISATACSVRHSTRGNLPDPAKVKQLKPGKQTEADVLALLGTPSSTSLFRNDKVWYYIAGQEKTVAFLPPKLEHQIVVQLDFSPKGLLRGGKLYRTNNGYKLSPTSRKTITAGNKTGILEQLFRNIGRYSGS